VEINLESTGVEKSCNIFWSQKLTNARSFVGGRIIVQQKKNLDSRMQLDEHAECASGGDPLLLCKILHLLFFPLVQILCALLLESKKVINMALMQDLQNFSFSGRGNVSPTHSELCCFVSGSQAKHQVSSPVIILLKKFLSALAITMSLQDVTRYSLCSGVEESG
jgi:hypothetical protein